MGRVHRRRQGRAAGDADHPAPRRRPPVRQFRRGDPLPDPRGQVPGPHGHRDPRLGQDRASAGGEVQGLPRRAPVRPEDVRGALQSDHPRDRTGAAVAHQRHGVQAAAGDDHAHVDVDEHRCLQEPRAAGAGEVGGADPQDQRHHGEPHRAEPAGGEQGAPCAFAREGVDGAGRVREEPAGFHRGRVVAPAAEEHASGERRGGHDQHRVQLPARQPRGARLPGRRRQPPQALQPLHVPGSAQLHQELAKRAEEAHRAAVQEVHDTGLDQPRRGAGR